MEPVALQLVHALGWPESSKIPAPPQTEQVNEPSPPHPGQVTEVYVFPDPPQVEHVAASQS